MSTSQPGPSSQLRHYCPVGWLWPPPRCLHSARMIGAHRLMRECRVESVNSMQGLHERTMLQASAEEGGVGSTVDFGMRFYSTLPDTFANSFKMNVGMLPSDAIIADRAYNTAAVADATLGYAASAQFWVHIRPPYASASWQVGAKLAGHCAQHQMSRCLGCLSCSAGCSETSACSEWQGHGPMRMLYS